MIRIVVFSYCKCGGWLTCWNVQICCNTDIAWTSEEPISRNVVEVTCTKSGETDEKNLSTYMREEMHMDVVATIIILFSLTLLARPAYGSAGDRHHIYLSCVKSCILKYGCPRKFDESGWIFSECFRCRYKCTWKTVKYFNDILHLSVPQFYGKWPFLAIWIPFIMPIPIQEFASVVFSILNLFTTFSMYRTVKRLRSSNRLKIVWTAYSVIGIIMWTCSAIFHWADFWLTEYLDYFTACAFIVFALFVSISFTIKSLQNCYRGRILWSFLFITLLYLYTNHIYNLTHHILQINFDYGYNMKMCIACSLLTAIIYCVWLVQQWKLRDHSGRRSLLCLTVMVIWGLLSVLLEVLDFVPIYWIIDSHSLFHLATVPLPLLMTRFILLENAHEMQQQIGNIKQT
uniref:Post-GPI attachment to proteins factor 3 n=1 Tax=Onchocerca volvulus TaxID=6282 RepID=A0A8R1TM24_ONCVO